MASTRLARDVRTAPPTPSTLSSPYVLERAVGERTSTLVDYAKTLCDGLAADRRLVMGSGPPSWAAAAPVNSARSLGETGCSTGKRAGTVKAGKKTGRT